jgi:hypothetical protein
MDISYNAVKIVEDDICKLQLSTDGRNACADGMFLESVAVHAYNETFDIELVKAINEGLLSEDAFTLGGAARAKLAAENEALKKAKAAGVVITDNGDAAVQQDDDAKPDGGGWLIGKEELKARAVLKAGILNDMIEYNQGWWFLQLPEKCFITTGPVVVIQARSSSGSSSENSMASSRCGPKEFFNSFKNRVDEYIDQNEYGFMHMSEDKKKSAVRKKKEKSSIKQKNRQKQT